MAGETVTFAEYAPGKVDKGQLVPIIVSDMTIKDALWWDNQFTLPHLKRTDRAWLWSSMLPACQLTQKLKHRTSRGVVVHALADNGKYVRSGMMIVIEDYFHLDVLDPGEACFAWFISVAEKDQMIERFQMSNPPSLVQVMIDIALVYSFNSDYDGRVGLHAAARGGDDLMMIYSQKCGLLQLDERAALPGGIKRENDGRFFYSTPELGRTLEEKLRYLRTPGQARVGV